MSLENFLFFAAFAALGFLGVGLLPFSLILAVVSFITFITVHKPSGPWGIIDPNLSLSLLTTFVMAVIYSIIYAACILVARSLKRRR